MHRLRLLTVTSLAVLSACAPPDSALRVNVIVRAQGTARVRADCIKLTISSETQELKSLTIKRPTDDEATFGVRRGSDLPGTVKVQAAGFLGSNCEDESTLKLNAQGQSVVGVFPEAGVTELSVFLDPPNATLDADRDGYVAAASGGLDCRDDESTIFPGGNQICANPADTDCDGVGGCDDSECGSAVVCANPPDQLVITPSISSMLRYDCRGPFTVELRNASGRRDAVRDTRVALSASLPGVTVHSSSTCTEAAVTSLPIPYDQSSFQVYLKADGQAFGLNTLTASAAQLMPGTASVEVHPQPIDHLDFITPVRTLSAGGCSADVVTLEFRDAQNRRTDVDAPATITLASAPSDLNNANIFFSNAGCTTEGSTPQLAPGQGQVSVYLLARSAGTFTLTATPSAGTGSTQPLTVLPAAPSKLAFTNGPVVLSTGQTCSAGLFTVQLQDQFDNAANAAADLPVQVSVTALQGVTLHDNTNDCNNAPMGEFIIPTGTSSVSLRAKGMNASVTTGSIVASTTTGISAATQILRISAGMASKFQLTGNPQMPAANVCSANPFSIELLDNANNAASSATALTFTLSTSPALDPSFRFYSGMGCQTDLGGMLTVPAGQTSATFYYRGNRAVPSFEIRASGALTAPGTFLPGNSVRAGPPGKLVFTAPLAQSTQVAVCTPSPYLANLLDIFDNPTSFPGAQTVTVSSSPAGVTVGASTCSSGNSVPLAAGALQASFTAQSTVTTPTSPYALTATVNGFSTVMPATLTVTPGPSMLSVDTPTGGTSTVAAGGCQQITLSRRDMFNNNAPTVGAATVTLAFPASTTWVVYSSNNCTTGMGATITMTNTHTVTFSVSPRTSGSQQVTVSIPSVGQSAVANITVTPGSPTLVFVTPATGTGNATASGVAGLCLPITIGRRDSFQNLVPLGMVGSVNFTLATGTTIHTGTPCLPGNAVTTIPLTATDADASFFVSATRSSLTGGPQLQNVIASLSSQTANLALTVRPAASTVSTVITLPAGGAASLLARQCQRVNVERRDAFNNLVPAVGSNLSVGTAIDLQTFTSLDCTGTQNLPIPVTAGASTRDFSLRLDTASASPRPLTVTVEGVSAPLALTISPAATSLFLVQGLPGTAVSGACLGPLTLRRRDAYGNDTTNGAISVAMSSSQFLFSSAADCSGAAASLGVNIADLLAVSAPFYASASLVGTATMTATLGPATGTGSVPVSAGAPSQLVFTTPVRTLTAGVCAGAGNVIAVQLRDAAGNPSNAGVGGQAITAVSSAGTGSWFTNNTCSTAAAGNVFTIAPGTSTVSLFYRDTANGMPSVSLTNGSGLTNPAAQVHTVNVGPAARLVFTTPAARSFVAAQCGGAGTVITVQLQDMSGNPVNAGVGGQAFTAVSSSAGPVNWYTDSGCTAVAGSGAFTIPAGSDSVSLYYVDNRAGAPTITLANGSLLTNPAGQGHTVAAAPPARLVFTSGAQTIAALTCSALTTITMQDLGGNVVNAGSNRVITLSATPGAANTTFYSNAGCTTALAANEITMNSGSSAVTIFFRSENAGALTLAADSPSMTQGTQPATITLAPPTQLSFVTAPPSPEAGFCQPVTVQRLDALNRPSTIASATTITPSFTPSTGIALFSDVNCTSAIASTFTIASGASSATVYVKGSNGSLAGVIPGTQVYVFTASSAVVNATLNITVQPMVRRRSAACTLAASTITCPITPLLSDISRTMLFFQATPGGADNNPADDNVTCRLNLNASLAAEVICDRVSNSADVTIEWQTVSFPYSFANGGVSVQHVTGGCVTSTANSMPVNVTLANAPLGNSFVLFSHRTGGTDNDGEHFFTGRLTTATNLQFSQSSASTTCTRTVDFDAQVVSWAGATVNRAVTLGGSGTSFTAPQNTVASSPTFLLYSSRMTGDTGGGNNICRRRLRGEITNATTLTFTRGCGGADIQDIAWEHVRLPAGATVQQLTGTTVSGSTSVGVTSTAVELTRAVAFFGGQGQGGSASGSTTYSANDRVGAALARPVWTSPTALTYTRSTGDLFGNFTGFVVQLTP